MWRALAGDAGPGPDRGGAADAGGLVLAGVRAATGKKLMPLGCVTQIMLITIAVLSPEMRPLAIIALIACTVRVG